MHRDYYTVSMHAFCNIEFDVFIFLLQSAINHNDICFIT